MSFILFFMMVLLFTINFIIALSMVIEALKKTTKSGYRIGYIILALIMVCNCIVILRGCFLW